MENLKGKKTANPEKLTAKRDKTATKSKVKNQLVPDLAADVDCGPGPSTIRSVK